jgi:hypothetical protein
MIVHPNKYRKLNAALIHKILGNGGGTSGPPPTSALVGFWLTQGGDWKDYSGNNNTLTNDGTSVSTFPTNNSPCVDWNNSARNAQAAGTIAKLQFSGNTPMTITTWIAAVNTPGCPLNTQDSTNSYQGYGLFAFTPTAGEIYFNMVHGGSGTITCTSSTGGTVNPSAPNFIALTYDGSGLSTGLNIYVNGVLVANTNSGSIVGLDCTSAAPLTLGSIPNNPFTDGLQGQQTDTRVYTIAATAVQIAALYAAGPAVYS